VGSIFQERFINAASVGELTPWSSSQRGLSRRASFGQDKKLRGGGDQEKGVVDTQSPWMLNAWSKGRFVFLFLETIG
jgi:hypothetical protein